MNKSEIKSMDAAVLAAIDCIVVVDHSTSMGAASHRFSDKTRMQEVEEACGGIAREAGKFDADGLTIIAFSSSAKVFDGVTPDKINQVFQEFPPKGSTALHLALDEAYKKASASGKQTVVIVYTDGQPDDESAVIARLNNAGTNLGRSKIGFVFVQVGNDAGATKFLAKLDDGLSVDVVDTIPAGEADDLTYAELAFCAFNG